MSLSCVGVQVWSTEIVDRHGEGQVETWRVDGLRVVKDGHKAWTKGPRWPEDWPWVADTWGHQQARVHTEE
jgi:hypothetical protein